jgi:hypothetical protein
MSDTNITIGPTNSTTIPNAIVIGQNPNYVTIPNDHGIALGQFAYATGAYSVAIGNHATSHTNYGIGIGSHYDTPRDVTYYDINLTKLQEMVLSLDKQLESASKLIEEQQMMLKEQRKMIDTIWYHPSMPGYQEAADNYDKHSKEQ